MRKLLLILLLSGLMVPAMAQIYVQLSVTAPPLPVASAGADTLVSSGTQLILMGSVTGGTPPYTFQWSPGAQLNDSTVMTPVVTATVTTTFTFHVTDANGCEASDEVVVNVSTVGIGGSQDEKVVIFPNPASGSLMVKGLPESDKPLEIEVLSVLGERVMKQVSMGVTPSVKLDVSALPPGLYLVRILSNECLTVRKVTIR